MACPDRTARKWRSWDLNQYGPAQKPALFLTSFPLCTPFRGILSPVCAGPRAQHSQARLHLILQEPREAGAAISPIEQMRKPRSKEIMGHNPWDLGLVLCEGTVGAQSGTPVPARTSGEGQSVTEPLEF